MAKREILPTDMWLWNSDGASPETWRQVMCISQTAVNIAVSQITSNTFCGNKSKAGTVTIEVPFQGEAYTDTELPEISAFELSQMARSKTVSKWKLAPVAPVAEDIISTFEGYLSQCNKQAQTDSPVTFDCNIVVDPSTYDEEKFDPETT